MTYLSTEPTDQANFESYSNSLQNNQEVEGMEVLPYYLHPSRGPYAELWTTLIQEGWMNEVGEIVENRFQLPPLSTEDIGVLQEYFSRIFDLSIEAGTIRISMGEILGKLIPVLRSKGFRLDQPTLIGRRVFDLLVNKTSYMQNFFEQMGIGAQYDLFRSQRPRAVSPQKIELNICILKESPSSLSFLTVNDQKDLFACMVSVLTSSFLEKNQLEDSVAKRKEIETQISEQAWNLKIHCINKTAIFQLLDLLNSPVSIQFTSKIDRLSYFTDEMYVVWPIDLLQSSHPKGSQRDQIQLKCFAGQDVRALLHHFLGVIRVDEPGTCIWKVWTGYLSRVTECGFSFQQTPAENMPSFEQQLFQLVCNRWNPELGGFEQYICGELEDAIKKQYEGDPVASLLFIFNACRCIFLKDRYSGIVSTILNHFLPFPGESKLDLLNQIEQLLRNPSVPFSHVMDLLEIGAFLSYTYNQPSSSQYRIHIVSEDFRIDMLQLNIEGYSLQLQSNPVHAFQRILYFQEHFPQKWNECELELMNMFLELFSASTYEVANEKISSLNIHSIFLHTDNFQQPSNSLLINYIRAFFLAELGGYQGACRSLASCLIQMHQLPLSPKSQKSITSQIRAIDQRIPDFAASDFPQQFISFLYLNGPSFTAYSCWQNLVRSTEEKEQVLVFSFELIKTFVKAHTFEALQLFSFLNTQEYLSDPQKLIELIEACLRLWSAKEDTSNECMSFMLDRLTSLLTSCERDTSLNEKLGSLIAQMYSRNMSIKAFELWMILGQGSNNPEEYRTFSFEQIKRLVKDQPAEAEKLFMLLHAKNALDHKQLIELIEACFLVLDEENSKSNPCMKSMLEKLQELFSKSSSDLKLNKRLTAQLKRLVVQATPLFPDLKLGEVISSQHVSSKTSQPQKLDKSVQTEEVENKSDLHEPSITPSSESTVPETSVQREEIENKSDLHEPSITPSSESTVLEMPVQVEESENKSNLHEPSITPPSESTVLETAVQKKEVDSSQSSSTTPNSLQFLIQSFSGSIQMESRTFIDTCLQNKVPDEVVKALLEVGVFLDILSQGKQPFEYLEVSQESLQTIQTYQRKSKKKYPGKEIASFFNRCMPSEKCCFIAEQKTLTDILNFSSLQFKQFWIRNLYARSNPKDCDVAYQAWENLVQEPENAEKNLEFSFEQIKILAKTQPHEVLKLFSHLSTMKKLKDFTKVVQLVSECTSSLQENREIGQELFELLASVISSLSISKKDKKWGGILQKCIQKAHQFGAINARDQLAYFRVTALNGAHDCYSIHASVSRLLSKFETREELSTSELTSKSEIVSKPERKKIKELLEKEVENPLSKQDLFSHILRYIDFFEEEGCSENIVQIFINSIDAQSVASNLYSSCYAINSFLENLNISLKTKVSLVKAVLDLNSDDIKKAALDLFLSKFVQSLNDPKEKEAQNELVSFLTEKNYVQCLPIQQEKKLEQQVNSQEDMTRNFVQSLNNQTEPKTQRELIAFLRENNYLEKMPQERQKEFDSRDARSVCLGNILDFFVEISEQQPEPDLLRELMLFLGKKDYFQDVNEPQKNSVRRAMSCLFNGMVYAMGVQQMAYLSSSNTPNYLEANIRSLKGVFDKYSPYLTGVRLSSWTVFFQYHHSICKSDKTTELKSEDFLTVYGHWDERIRPRLDFHKNFPAVLELYAILLAALFENMEGEGNAREDALKYMKTCIMRKDILPIQQSKKIQTNTAFKCMGYLTTGAIECGKLDPKFQLIARWSYTVFESMFENAPAIASPNLKLNQGEIEYRRGAVAVRYLQFLYSTSDPSRVTTHIDACMKITSPSFWMLFPRFLDTLAQQNSVELFTKVCSKLDSKLDFIPTDLTRIFQYISEHLDESFAIVAICIWSKTKKTYVNGKQSAEKIASFDLNYWKSVFPCFKWLFAHEISNPSRILCVERWLTLGKNFEKMTQNKTFIQQYIYLSICFFPLLSQYNGSKLIANSVFTRFFQMITEWENHDDYQEIQKAFPLALCYLNRVDLEAFQQALEAHWKLLSVSEKEKFLFEVLGIFKKDTSLMSNMVISLSLLLTDLQDKSSLETLKKLDNSLEELRQMTNAP